jgi:hypothetical protein
LDVWIDETDTFVVIRHSPVLGYRVARIRGDDPGFGGHDMVFNDVDEVVSFVGGLLSETR